MIYYLLTLWQKDSTSVDLIFVELIWNIGQLWCLLLFYTHPRNPPRIWTPYVQQEASGYFTFFWIVSCILSVLVWSLFHLVSFCLAEALLMSARNICFVEKWTPKNVYDVYFFLQRCVNITNITTNRRDSRSGILLSLYALRIFSYRPVQVWLLIHFYFIYLK